MDRDYILKKACEIMPKRRIEHTQGVRDTALKLAERYGVDRDKAEVAAICHDIYRVRLDEGLNELIDRYGVDERYKDNPALAHSKIAAIALRKDLGVDDEDIIAAVEFHTTGRAGMSDLEKIIYLADGIEPGRDYPGVDELRNLAEENLDLAVLQALEHSVEYVKSEGIRVEQDSLDAIEYIKELEK